MSNSSCPVGAANAAKIDALNREQEVQRKAVGAVNDRLDKINWWLVATLGGVVVNLLLQIAGRVGG
ncbi:MAG: hypothetical protein GX881_08685 [Firmicutes bacterium]|nr:hypothetical protein [Bacillota bacterium]